MDSLNLSITTKKIEIKVVKVGGSKMTLAVFNQIIEDKLIDQNVQYKGEVLGYVHRKNEYWVLWVNQSNELRRMLYPELAVNLDNLLVSKEEKEYYYTLLDGNKHLLKNISNVPDKLMSFNKLYEIKKFILEYTDFHSIYDIEEFQTIRIFFNEYDDFNSETLILRYDPILSSVEKFLEKYLELNKQLFTANNQLFIAT